MIEIVYRSIKPHPRLKPVYSASPQKRTLSFGPEPKPKEKPKGKAYAESYKNDD